MGFGYARCWAVNKPTTIEDERGKTNPNKGNTSLSKEEYHEPLGGAGLNIDVLNLTFVKLKDWIFSRAQRLTI